MGRAWYMVDIKSEYKILTNSVALVRQRPPLVGEVSANFCGYKGVALSVRWIPYGRNLGFLDREYKILVLTI
jgi:hypothetical protein